MEGLLLSGGCRGTGDILNLKIST